MSDEKTVPNTLDWSRQGSAATRPAAPTWGSRVADPNLRESAAADGSRGWPELADRAARSRTRRRLLPLRDGYSLLEIRDGRATVLSVVPAPDGEYALQRSGRLVVKSGKFHEMLGLADADMGPNPEG